MSDRATSAFSRRENRRCFWKRPTNRRAMTRTIASLSHEICAPYRETRNAENDVPLLVARDLRLLDWRAKHYTRNRSSRNEGALPSPELPLPPISSEIILRRSWILQCRRYMPQLTSEQWSRLSKSAGGGWLRNETRLEIDLVDVSNRRTPLWRPIKKISIA